MNENSYFNPRDMWEQCNAAIESLEEDNSANDIIKNKILMFIAEPMLTGAAYEALKQHMLDYLTILQAMKLANEADLTDFRFLKLMSTGHELEGRFILEGKENAISAKRADEEKIEEYSKKAKKEKSVLLRQHYLAKVTHYMAMEVIEQKLYNEFQKKEAKYDAIEAYTCGLFEQGATIRAVVENALSGMQGAFQNGMYVADMNASWRSELNKVLGESNIQNSDEKILKGSISQKIQTELLEMGYTQKEIDILCQRGVSLTYKDISSLKLTVETEKVYRTEDGKALMYNGKIYYIYVPQTGIGYDVIWETEWKKVLKKTDFDLAAGVLGINMEDIPKEEITTGNKGYRVQEAKISSNDKNATTASAMHILMGMTGFLVSALQHTEVTLVFESNCDSRRVTISVGDSQSRLEFQEKDYNIPINTYQSAEDWMSEKYASDYAKGIYKSITGKNVPNMDAAYTITGTVDEGHRECNVSGYLSYSDTGEMIYTPLVLPGDTAYVAECMKHTGYYPEEILDCTELLSNSIVADEKVREILEEVLEEN